MPELAKGVGSGCLAFVCGASRRTDRVEINAGPEDRGWMIHRVLVQELEEGQRLYVEDLHRLLIRCGEAVLHIPIIGDSIIDMSFCRAWLGMPSISFPDMCKRKGLSMALMGQLLWQAVTEEGRDYYTKHYVPTILAYAKHEQKPIEVYDDADRKHLALVHYQFTSGKTSRLAPEARFLDTKRHLFNPHSIPRDDRPKYIRAGRKRRICTVDYNAAEMRTLAALSGDKHLAKVFRLGVDLYSLVLNGCNIKNCDRAMVKQIVLQLFYGGRERSIATRLGLPLEAIGAIESRMREYFPVAWGYLDELADEASRNGFVVTCTGRRIPLDKKDIHIARKKIPNACIQSTTADLNNVMFGKFISQTGRSKPLFHIHDGYVFDIPYDYIDEETEFLTDEACVNPISDFLPGVLLKADAKVSKVWE